LLQPVSKVWMYWNMRMTLSKQNIYTRQILIIMISMNATTGYLKSCTSLTPKISER
jgi:hypothetical protein